MNRHQSSRSLQRSYDEFGDILSQKSGDEISKEHHLPGLQRRNLIKMDSSSKDNSDRQNISSAVGGVGGRQRKETQDDYDSVEVASRG